MPSRHRRCHALVLHWERGAIRLRLAGLLLWAGAKVSGPGCTTQPVSVCTNTMYRPGAGSSSGGANSSGDSGGGDDACVGGGGRSGVREPCTLNIFANDAKRTMLCWQRGYARRGQVQGDCAPPVWIPPRT
eukprot:4317741-Prymnesium_polylepis.1